VRCCRGNAGFGNLPRGFDAAGSRTQTLVSGDQPMKIAIVSDAVLGRQIILDATANNRAPISGLDIVGMTIKDVNRSALGEIVLSLESLESVALTERQSKWMDLTQTLIGGVRDLQRHAKVAIDEDPTRIPPGLLAVIGAMHKAIESSLS